MLAGAVGRGYAPDARGRSTRQKLHHPVHESAIRRLEQVAGRHARLPQHRHRLGHRVEAGAAVVGAHAAGADAAERTVAGGEVQDLTSVVEGTRVSVRVDLVGGRILKKTNTTPV